MLLSPPPDKLEIYFWFFNWGSMGSWEVRSFFHFHASFNAFWSLHNNYVIISNYKWTYSIWDCHNCCWLFEVAMGLNQNQFLEHDDDKILLNTVRLLSSVQFDGLVAIPVRLNWILSRYALFRVESQPSELHYQASSLRIESLSIDFEFLAPSTAFSAGTQRVTFICAHKWYQSVT